MPDFAVLEAVLDEAAFALKSGNLHRLSDLSDQAEVAIGGIGRPNGRPVERVRDKARRNAALIEAAIKGVKAARQRAKDLSATGQFTTYDATGHRNQVGLVPLPTTRRV